MLDYGYVSTNNSQPNLDELVNASVLSFDTETSGVSTAKDIPYGFSLASNPNSAYYTNMNNRFFLDLLADERKLKVCHSAKFDRSMLKKFGIVVNNLCCTLVAAHLLEENRLSLAVLLKRFIINYDLDIKFFKDFNKPIPHATLQEMANHFGPHSAATLALWNVLQRELRANNLWNVFWDIEMPLVPVLSDMELNGAMIDTKYLGELGVYYDERIFALNEAMCEFAGRRGINFNSADQAAEVLYEGFKVPKPPVHMKKLWTEKGRPTVDKSYLEQFKGKRFPIVNIYLMYKMYRHLKDTYVDGITKRLIDGRIHTNFNQTRTRTGRLSSTDPNLQAIPLRAEEGKKIRRSFVAPEGKKIVKADMDQIELRKAACLSNCETLLDAFREGRDIHTETAIRAFNDPERRFDGKTMNFKLVYMGGTPEEQALLFSIYPEVKTWSDGMLHEFEILGYARTHYGRRRHLGNFERMSRKEIAHAHREGLSTMNQGCVPGEMRIMVYGLGYVPIDSVSGKYVKVWDGDSYVDASVLPSGKKERIVVKLYNGQELYCSPDHVFATKLTNGTSVWRKTSELGKRSQLVATGEVEDPKGSMRLAMVPDKGSWNYRALSFRDIKSDFDLGVVLGRLVADGSTTLGGERRGGQTEWFVAEHEQSSLLPYLRRVLSVFGTVKEGIQHKKNESITILTVNSNTLAAQAAEFYTGTRKSIPPIAYSSKEILRGFLRGFYDGDGGVSTLNVIYVRQGKGEHRRKLMRDVQQALALFGIRSRLTVDCEDAHKVSISTKSNFKFRDMIGFINPDKQNRITYNAPTSEAFGNTEKVEEIVFTGELVDMYDVINSESGKFMVEGFITHNSCAEYLKIGMRKVWNEIHDSNIKMLLQVHDELIFECPINDVPDLVDIIKRDLTYNELQIPLTVSISVGDTWAETVDIGEKK